MPSSRPSRRSPSPTTCPFELAALFGCAVLTGVGAVMNAARITSDDTSRCSASGGVGMSAVLGARLAGARSIIAVDTVASKLELAQRIAGAVGFAGRRRCRGAHPLGDRRRRGLRDRDRRQRRGPGPRPTPPRAADGTTITVGLPHPDRMLTIPAVSLAAEERTLRGSYLGSSVPVRDVPRFIEHYRDGDLPVAGASHPPDGARRDQRGL